MTMRMFAAAMCLLLLGQAVPPLPSLDDSTPPDEPAVSLQVAVNPDPVWSTSLNIDGNRLRITDVAVDGEGNCYVVGTTDGSGPCDNGDQDGFAVKIDPAGQVLWDRQFGSEEADHVACMTLDGLGNCYIAAVTPSVSPGPNTGENDVLVVTLDTDGNELSRRQLGLRRGDQPGPVAIDEAGNCYIIGRSVHHRNFQSDVFVWRIAADGSAVEWRDRNDTVFLIPQDIAVGADGECFVVWFDTGRAVSATPPDTDEAAAAGCAEKISSDPP